MFFLLLFLIIISTAWFTVDDPIIILKKRAPFCFYIPLCLIIIVSNVLCYLISGKQRENWLFCLRISVLLQLLLTTSRYWCIQLVWTQLNDACRPLMHILLPPATLLLSSVSTPQPASSSLVLSLYSRYNMYFFNMYIMDIYAFCLGKRSVLFDGGFCVSRLTCVFIFFAPSFDFIDWRRWLFNDSTSLLWFIWFWFEVHHLLLLLLRSDHYFFYRIEFSYLEFVFLASYLYFFYFPFRFGFLFW